MTLVNDANYIHFLRIFPTSLSSFTLHVEALQKNESNFTCFARNVG